MGKCKNCKYWPNFVWGFGNRRWRICKKINGNLIFEPHTKVYQPPDLDNSYVAVAIDQLVDTVELYTGENFGCIHFVRKG